jgi:hypothetical protein
MNEMTALDRVGIRRLLLYMQKTIMDRTKILGENSEFTWDEFCDTWLKLIEDHVKFCSERKAFRQYSITNYLNFDEEGISRDRYYRVKITLTMLADSKPVDLVFVLSDNNKVECHVL